VSIIYNFFTISLIFLNVVILIKDLIKSNHTKHLETVKKYKINVDQLESSINVCDVNIRKSDSTLKTQKVYLIFFKFMFP